MLNRCGGESHCLTFIDLPGVVCLKIKLTGNRVASQKLRGRRSALHRSWYTPDDLQMADRSSALNADARTQSQRFQPALGERVTEKAIDHIAAICVQRADGKLVTQFIQTPVVKSNSELMLGSVWPLSLRNAPS